MSACPTPRLGPVDRGDETPVGVAPTRPDAPVAPMMLSADQAVGDPATMLACLVEDYARLGTPAETIRSLFREPFFQATFGLRELFGGEEIERRVEAILGRCGVFNVRIVELPVDPDAGDDAASSAEGHGPDDVPCHDALPTPSVCSACAHATACSVAPHSFHVEGGPFHA